VFEPLVHLRMKDHGLGPIVISNMDDTKKQFILELPSNAMPVVVIKAAADMTKLNYGDYGEPDKGNFPCIDAVVRLKDGTFVLIQTTVGNEHPIKGERLKDILALLPAQKEYPLVFMTVEGNDQLCGSQKLLCADGKKALQKPTGLLKDVRQYVYHLPLLPPVAPSAIKAPVLSGLALKATTKKK